MPRVDITDQFRSQQARVAAGTPEAAPVSGGRKDITSQFKSDPDTERVESGLRQVKAGARGVGQGLTFGFGDELAGVAGAALSTVLPEALGGDKPKDSFLDTIADFPRKYRESRDFARAELKASQEEFPLTFAAGELAGSFALPVPGVGGARGVGIGGTVKAALARGAAEGALSGAGMSEGDDLLKDIAESAALGGGFTAVSKGMLAAAKGLNSVSRGMGFAANAQSFSAILGGSNKRLWKKAKKMGTIQRIGKEGLRAQEALGGQKLVSFGRSADDIAEDVIPLVDGLEKEMTKALREADETYLAFVRAQGSSPNLPVVAGVGQGAVSGKNIAERIRRYAQKFNIPMGDAPRIHKMLLKQADASEKWGNMSLAEANIQKHLFGFDPSKAKNLSETDSKLYGFIKKEMDDTFERIGQEVAHKRGLGQIYVTAKTQLGDLKMMKEMGEDALARSANSPTVSFGAKATGAALGTIVGASGGTTIPAIIAAAAGGAAAQTLRKRGMSSSAVLTNGISSLLDKAPGFFGKYTPVLDRARRAGTLEAVHQMLMDRDEEYVAKVEGLEEELVQ